MKVIVMNIFKLSIKIIYFFLKLMPINYNKIVFISRQTNYIHIDFKMIKEEIERRNKDIKMIFMCKRLEKGIINSIKYYFTTIRQMYHLATSKMAIIDSYCIPVCVLKHKKELKVLQIWHSIGKIKKSGYQTVGTASGRTKEMAEVMCMHKNYDAIIAGGVKFNSFYKEGFNVSEEVLLNYGLPRIDYLIKASQDPESKVYKKFPELKDKKIVYYAPTFRTYSVNGPQKLIDEYNPKDFALIVTCHPNQKLKIDTSKVYKLDLNEFSNVDILKICDYLITDYSSIALEAAVLNKKTLYYLYDYDKYVSYNGLNLDPKKVMPTCSFENPTEILNIINNDTYDSEALEKYIENYLPKKIGQSTNLIVDYIMKNMQKFEKKKENMEYIIMAGGAAKRWENYNNTTKHLVKVGNESLLQRIVRQLRENNINNISITSNNLLYEIPGTKRNEMIYDSKMYNMFYYKALDNEVTFLYGDTFYTDEVMRQIVETKTDDILFFGTDDSIIAVKVVNHIKFKKYVEEMKEYNDGRAGWALYRRINNLSQGDYTHCSNFVWINDEIVNVNTPSDYEKLTKDGKASIKI